MQLVLALVIPVVLLLGFTALLATDKLSISRKAAWLLERQGSIWMAGIVALAAAAAVVALQR
jgi:cytochrome c oxidase assembly factor CtaG